MRKLLIPVAAAVSTLAFAAPASAQWFPQPQPRGHAYGHYNNYGQARALEARVDNLQRQIAMLDSRGMISNREARILRGEVREAKRLLRRYAPGGITGREAYAVQRQIALTERKLHRDVRDGNRYGYNGYNGYQGNNGYNGYYGY